jgi:uncharacterized protein (DUF58 family)
VARIRYLPGRPLLLLVAAGTAIALAALLLGAGVKATAWAASIWMLVLAATSGLDFTLSRRLWLAGQPQLQRHLPQALAIGNRCEVELGVQLQGESDWHCTILDQASDSLQVRGMPASLHLRSGYITSVTYEVRPVLRGDVEFGPAHLRLRSRLGTCDLQTRLGGTQQLRVYPDFSQVTRYAWLAGDRRLQEIGVKAFRQRGEGTDFKQLAEYLPGDPVRRIDWKATQRHSRPVVRQYQDERNQSVQILLDCGRRMRADDRAGPGATTHFDDVLNAVLLLAYVALNQGDAVGASTFGVPPGNRRAVPPRKGMHVLGQLMSALYDQQPTTTHTDYVQAARDFLARQQKRSLVVVITNFRDEDSVELQSALSILRQRHLVLVASLRERIVGELLATPLTSGANALDVASAHLHAQSRRDAFLRLAARDGLMVDAEPQQLGIDLVNRYHAAKRAGMI